MKLRVWFALCRGVMLEAIRRKELWVVAILGFVIMASAGALGFFGMRGLEGFAKDLAASVLGLFSTIVAVLSSCRLIPEEIKNRTLYPLLARPISRFDLLFGKYLGAVSTTWVAFLLLSGMTGLALAIFGVGFEPIMLQYLVAKMLGLAVLCAVSMALGSIMTPQAAATISFVLALGSSMMIRGLMMAYATASPAMQPVFKLMNWIVPQYGLFDLGSRAANFHWSPVPIWVMVALAIYAVLYSSAMLCLSWLKFRKQAV